ncbi:MAG: sensor histidine kinase [Chloroflexi bacterium]|nr:sensor histidine kinase [Chloroflexota bacterium]
MKARLTATRDLSSAAPVTAMSWADRAAALLRVPLALKLIVANGALLLTVAGTVAYVDRMAFGAAVSVTAVPGIAVVALFGMIAATGVNALLVRWALAPLRELERVATAVENGDLLVRARLGPIRDRQTERIGALANRILDAHDQHRHQIEAAAAQLSRLSAREMETREVERGEVAIELREEIGQVLTAITVALQALVNEIDAGGPLESAQIRDRVAELIVLARDSHERCLRRAQGLRPSVLDDLGLVPALRSAIARFGATHGLDIVFTVSDPPPRPPRHVGTALYRVVEEAIANTVRHAGATHIDVDLVVDDGALRVAIVDDGQGFDATRSLDPRMLGIAAMRQRVKALGGELALWSEVGEGTRVEASVPEGAWMGDAPTPHHISGDSPIRG